MIINEGVNFKKNGQGSESLIFSTAQSRQNLQMKSLQSADDNQETRISHFLVTTAGQTNLLISLCFIL
jgi:hypothetical protein